MCSRIYLFLYFLVSFSWFKKSAFVLCFRVLIIWQFLMGRSTTVATKVVVPSECLLMDPWKECLTALNWFLPRRQMLAGTEVKINCNSSLKQDETLMLFSQLKSDWKVPYMWLKGDCMNDSSIPYCCLSNPLWRIC